MSFRTDTWLNMTQGVGQTLPTAVNTCYGGSSTAAEITNAFLTLGMGVATAALSAKQANNAQGNSAVNAMTLAHTALAQAGVVDGAIGDYETAVKELASLEEQQTAVKNLDTLNSEIDGIAKNQSNAETLRKFNELKGNVDNLTNLQTSATKIESEISSLKAEVEKPINTQLPNAFTTITGDGSDAVAQVERNKSAYGDGESFNSVAYNQDVSAARDIQTAAEQKKIKEVQLENKENELQALKKQPGGDKIQGDVSSDTIKAALSKAESELNQFTTNKDNTLQNGGETINIVAYNDKLSEQKSANANKDTNFEAKINAQKTVVATKRKAVLAQKATLQATRNDLARLAQSMQNVITEQGEADAVKTTRDNYNKTHKRGFFKKLFGTGKDATQKANDKSYKKEKSEAKAASATFAQAYSFKADAAGLQTVNDALREIDAKLAKIAAIEAEAEV